MAEIPGTSLKALLDVTPEPLLAPRSDLSEPVLPAGTVTHGALTDLVPGSAQLTANLPEGTALLCVFRAADGPEKIAMSWHDGHPTREARQLDFDAAGKSRTIADLMHTAREQAKEPSRDWQGSTPSPFEGPWQAAYRRVAAQWKGVPELAEWVRSLVAAAGSAAQLIIWDATGEDIPWELYFGELGKGPDGRPENGFLGVRLPVARWIGGVPRPEDYDARRHEAVGGVLLFDDWATHKTERRDDYDAIAGLLVGSHETSMDALMRRLEADEEVFALLMIRGHGDYHEDVEAFTMAGLPLGELAMLNMDAVYVNQPTVLLNLCSSGRSFVDDSVYNNPVRSFVEPFIKHRASAVIAVLADVDITHLHDVALRLIGDAASEPVVVTEWLRERREFYYDELNSCARSGREERVRMFLTSCLYVCYCHPWTTLRIRAEDKDGDLDGAA